MNLNKNTYFNISLIIDIYEKEQINIAQAISAMMMEEITFREFDKIGLSIITDILDIVLIPMPKS